MRLVNALFLTWILALLPLAGPSHAAVCSEIAIGSVLSFTGKYSTEGAHTRNGYEFAIERLKAAGGLIVGDKCYHFRVIYYDDESLPERGAQLAARLIEKDRVRFLLGPNSADVANAVAQVADLFKVPVLLPQGTSRKLYQRGHRYVFGLQSVADQYLDPAFELAARVAANMGYKKSNIKIALATASGSYTDDVRRSLRASVARFGATIALDERVPDDLSDVSAMLAKVRTAKPDLLIVSAHAKGAQTAIRQIGEYQIHVPIIVMTQCEAAAIITRYKHVTENMICAARSTAIVDPGADQPGRADRFAKAFRVKYKTSGTDPIPGEVIQAATVIDVLANAFGRAASLDSEKVRDALAATNMSVMNGRVKFSPGGRNVMTSPIVLRQIQKGRYNNVAPPSRATHNLQWPRDGL